MVDAAEVKDAEWMPLGAWHVYRLLLMTNVLQTRINVTKMLLVRIQKCTRVQHHTIVIVILDTLAMVSPVKVNSWIVLFSRCILTRLLLVVDKCLIRNGGCTGNEECHMNASGVVTCTPAFTYCPKAYPWSSSNGEICCASADCNDGSTGIYVCSSYPCITHPDGKKLLYALKTFFQVLKHTSNK